MLCDGKKRPSIFIKEKHGGSLLYYCVGEDIALMVLYMYVYHDAYIVLTAMYGSEEYSIYAK